MKWNKIDIKEYMGKPLVKTYNGMHTYGDNNKSNATTLNVCIMCSPTTKFM